MHSSHCIVIMYEPKELQQTSTFTSKTVILIFAPWFKNLKTIDFLH